MNESALNDGSGTLGGVFGSILNFAGQGLNLYGQYQTLQNPDRGTQKTTESADGAAVIDKEDKATSAITTTDLLKWGGVALAAGVAVYVLTHR